MYPACRPHPEVSVEVIVNVARTEEEADIQARGERINRDGRSSYRGRCHRVEPCSKKVRLRRRTGCCRRCYTEAETPAEEAGAEDAAPSEEDSKRLRAKTLTTVSNACSRQTAASGASAATTRWRGLVFSFMLYLSILLLALIASLPKYSTENNPSLKTASYP